MNQSVKIGSALSGLAAVCIASAASAAPQLGAWMKSYNVYAGGDLNYVCSHLEGTVGAGGQARFNRMAIATAPVKKAIPGVASGGAFSLYDSSIDGDVEAGGNATLRNYSVGRVTSGGIAYCASTGTHRGCSSSSARTVDHAALRNEMMTFARALNLESSSYVPASIGASLELFLAEGASVISVDAETLVKAKRFVLNASARSTVHVKVLGGRSVAWTGRGMSLGLKGGIQPSAVMWTFLDATDLMLYSINVPGTVFVPYGNIFFQEGRIDGNLWAGGNIVGNPQSLSTDTSIDCGAGSSGGHVTYAPFTGR